MRRRALFALAASERLESAVRAVPALRVRARAAAGRYVAGETLDEALAVAHRLRADGLDASLDLFGEREHDRDAIQAALRAYEALAARAGEAWLSVDLSHVGLEHGSGPAANALRRIADALRPGARLQVGAEEAQRAEAVLEVVLVAAGAGASLTATVQANLRRAPADAARLAEAGVPVRLVKGAYVEAPSVARPYGEETDLAYLRIARDLLARGAGPILATHDPLIRAALPADLPCELLLGVRSADARELAAAGRSVRIYVPYGPGWFRYWLRRVAEAQGLR